MEIDDAMDIVEQQDQNQMPRQRSKSSANHKKRVHLDDWNSSTNSNSTPTFSPRNKQNNNRNNNVLPSIGANNKPLWQAGGGATLGSFRNQRNLGNNAGQKKKNWFSGGQNAGSRGPRGQFGRLNLKE